MIVAACHNSMRVAGYCSDGRNATHRHLFKEVLQPLADRQNIDLDIRVTHYPPVLLKK